MAKAHYRPPLREILRREPKGVPCAVKRRILEIARKHFRSRFKRADRRIKWLRRYRQLPWVNFDVSHAIIARQNARVRELEREEASYLSVIILIVISLIVLALMSALYFSGTLFPKYYFSFFFGGCATGRATCLSLLSFSNTCVFRGLLRFLCF